MCGNDSSAYTDLGDDAMAFINKKQQKTAINVAEFSGKSLGNYGSEHARQATSAAVEGMSYFREKVMSPIVQNGQFDAQKGNLFEYIEAAKFNVDAARKGIEVEAIVTDRTDPHAAADIIIQKQGKTVKEIQAKFIKSSSNGKDTSAAKSVYAQTGAGNKGRGQYDGMDRLIRKDLNYNKEGSLLDETKKLSGQRAESGSIYADSYKDVHDHLTDETHYKNVTSGGTTFEEVKEAYDTSKAYALKFEYKSLTKEITSSAANMAAASFVTSGIISGIINIFEVYKNEKDLKEALKETGTKAVKSGMRGGTAGAISSAIRYGGAKMGSTLLTDSAAATVMAGGLIDSGVALLAYAKGEISKEELKEDLLDTSAKAVATVYYNKTIAAIIGTSLSPFVTIAVYTTASYMVTCTREILKNAKLNAEEYDRMTALLLESTRQVEEYRREFELYLRSCEDNQAAICNRLLDSFTHNLETGENYDEAINAIVQFANETGIILQYIDFDDFDTAMREHRTLVLS